MLGFTLMANTVATPIAFALFTLAWKIVDWIVNLQDLYSHFCFLSQSYAHLFILSARESFWICVAGKSKKADGAVASIMKPCINEDVKNEALIKGDLEVVMQRLGISWDSSENEFQERSGLGEISTLFDEIEPSLEEVKEAFDLFDDDRDGYIDAKDLAKILSTLGYVDISDLEYCQRMIMAFSSNGEKRIDFRKFVKIVEDSFCNQPDPSAIA